MIKIVVPISGGKDSQACLKLALQEYDKNQILGLFCDTQFEHPLTYSHINIIRELYGVKIIKISAGSVPEIVLKTKQFPGGIRRLCTDRLKIVPSKKFYTELQKQQGHGFQVWLGMRIQESSARSRAYSGFNDNELYAPHDFGKGFPKYLEKLGVMFRLPVVTWSENDIFNFLCGEQNILYSQGEKRVGCFPCLASSDFNKERNFNYDDFGRSQRIIVSELEKKIGRSVWNSKAGALRNNENQDDIFNGCTFCAI